MDRRRRDESVVVREVLNSGDGVFYPPYPLAVGESGEGGVERYVPTLVDEVRLVPRSRRPNDRGDFSDRPQVLLAYARLPGAYIDVISGLKELIARRATIVVYQLRVLQLVGVRLHVGEVASNRLLPVPSLLLGIHVEYEGAPDRSVQVVVFVQDADLAALPGGFLVVGRGVIQPSVVVVVHGVGVDEGDLARASQREDGEEGEEQRPQRDYGYVPLLTVHLKPPVRCSGR